ncbi:MAG: HAD-IC family P-type ATPase, partial [Betaproteobacteria bacterium]
MTDPSNAQPSGLSQQEAEQRLASDGPNEIEPSRRRSLVRRIGGLLAEPMFALLLAAVLIYLALGDLGEGLTLALFVLAVLGLTLYQEGRADQSIEALRRLSERRVQVMRDGLAVERPVRDIVRGDCLVLAEGRRLAADGRLLQADHLQVDESLLTGESQPVEKSVDAPQTASVFAGTYVVSGRGLMEVLATGPRTQVGQIGRSLQSLDQQATPLQLQTARLVRVLAALALLLCTAMVLIEGS